MRRRIVRSRSSGLRVNVWSSCSLCRWMMYAADVSQGFTGVLVGGGARDDPLGAPAHDFERLFREDGPGVWRTIYAFTGGRREVAEECVAEAFARAIAHAGTIRDPLAWIYRTAFRLAAAELKREGRRPAPDVDEAMEARADTGELMGAFRSLSPVQRGASLLRRDA